jgi:hypothetical protein
MARGLRPPPAGAEREILRHGHHAEQAAAVGDQRDARLDDPVRGLTLDRAPLEQDPFAGSGPDEADDRVEHRRLAGPVGSQDGRRLPGRHAERHLVLGVGDADAFNEDDDQEAQAERDAYGLGKRARQELGEEDKRNHPSSGPQARPAPPPGT